MENKKIRSDQFAALWPQAGGDGAPIPFVFDVSSGWQSEDARIQNEIRDAFAGDAGDEVRNALKILAEPEVFVSVFGKGADGRVIRMIGGLSTGWSAVAIQLPGATDDVGGEIVLGLAQTVKLAHLLVGALPANAGGRRTFARNEPEPEFFSGSILQDVNGPSPLPRFEDAVRARYAGAGVVRVFAGPRYRSTLVGSLRWFDVSGDGRYMISSSDPDEAVSASPAVLVSAIAGWLREGLEMFREAEEDVAVGGWR